MDILIVEDEDLAVRKLQKMLMNIDPALNIVGVCDSITATVLWLRNNTQPDLILMDIELADGQSCEIFKIIEVCCPVIFTTSYNETEIAAFNLDCPEYLFKPVQKDELRTKLLKFRKELKEG
jgi:two-component system response regulator LytT